MKKFALAAAALAATFAVAAPASADTHGRGWHKPHHHVCHWEMRHHHKVRVCR